MPEMDRSERHRLSFGLFSSGPIFIRRCSPGLVVDPLVGGWRWPTGRARHRSSEQLGTAETKKGLKRVFCALIVTIICAGSAVADADHRGAAGHGWPSWPARPHTTSTVRLRRTHIGAIAYASALLAACACACAC